MQVHRKNYPEIQVSCVASAGVEGYTCQRSGASPSLSLSLSSWTCRSSPPPTQPPPHRSRPVQPSHAWPSLGIYSGCFLFIASAPLSCCSFSICDSSSCLSFYLSHDPTLLCHAHVKNLSLLVLYRLIYKFREPR